MMMAHLLHRIQRPLPAARRPVGLALIILAFALGAGCASDKPTTRPANLSDRADQALRDPFGYEPMKDKEDVSGGGLTDLNKDALKKDVDHVLNP